MTLRPFAAALAAVAAAAAALGLAGTAFAQSADVSPAKKELIARVLKAQQPGVESMARALALQPAQQVQLGAQRAMQRVPADKREALGKEIDGDLQKYAEEAVPLVRDKAMALAPATFTPILEKNFSEDELKQIVATLESPVIQKFQQSLGQLQQGLSNKLVAEVRGSLEPKIKALDQTVAGRVNKAIGSAAPAK